MASHEWCHSHRESEPPPPSVELCREVGGLQRASRCNRVKARRRQPASADRPDGEAGAGPGGDCRELLDREVAPAPRAPRINIPAGVFCRRW